MEALQDYINSKKNKNRSGPMLPLLDLRLISTNCLY
uniref:Uncharacterized protein n=1 Tax=Arundo donax TaxID=35708 RepID=A0A0A9CJV7_ARUDO